jgi:hypothetical protein
MHPLLTKALVRMDSREQQLRELASPSNLPLAATLDEFGGNHVAVPLCFLLVLVRWECITMVSW